MNQSGFKKICILGPGLLGGSLGMAVRHWMPDTQVVLWGRRAETLEDAMELGAADSVTTDIETAISGCNLVVLATPVGIMPRLIEQGMSALQASGALVTDVGSVKQMVHQKIGHPLTQAGIPFIGSHPMAGSEKTGIRAASTYLFQKATVILTNDEGITQDQVQKLTQFWQKVGCFCLELPSHEHDTLIARVSHFPHFISSLCSKVSVQPGKEALLGRLAGNGMRDTTRVSSGNPEMWAEILMENKTALLPLITQAQAELTRILEIMTSPDHHESQQTLQSWLAEAKKHRDTTLS